MDRRDFIAESAAAMSAGALSRSAQATLGDDPAVHDRRMGWWWEARFGMFVVWGIYALLAGEWKG